MDSELYAYGGSGTEAEEKEEVNVERTKRPRSSELSELLTSALQDATSLRLQNQQLKLELAELRKKIEESNSPDSASLELSFVLPNDIDSASIGKQWKGTEFGFPHSVMACTRTGTRELVVENRPHVSVIAHLTRRDGVDANENSLRRHCKEAVIFQLEVVYANTLRVVRVEDLSGKPTHLIDPPEVCTTGSNLANMPAPV
tara:strand:- start:345 stop:947 length:603 start_codon:yes stop_codon:yes gene_type:complete